MSCCCPSLQCFCILYRCNQSMKITMHYSSKFSLVGFYNCYIRYPIFGLISSNIEFILPLPNHQLLERTCMAYNTTEYTNIRISHCMIIQLSDQSSKFLRVLRQFSFSSKLQIWCHRGTTRYCSQFPYFKLKM